MLVWHKKSLHVFLFRGPLIFVLMLCTIAICFRFHILVAAFKVDEISHVCWNQFWQDYIYANRWVVYRQSTGSSNGQYLCWFYKQVYWMSQIKKNPIFGAILFSAQFFSFKSWLKTSWAFFPLFVLPYYNNFL